MALKGRIITEEHKRKIVETRRKNNSYIAWNKGLKGFLKGRKITWADKISQGKKNSEKLRLASQKAGKNMSKNNFGRKRSEETKKKMRGRKPWNKGLEPFKQPRWQGGKSFEPYTVDWTKTLRRSIRERDNYVCQLGGELQGDRIFDVHHIDYDKKNCNPENLITLCRKCHGKTSKNRDFWTNYFNKLKI